MNPRVLLIVIDGWTSRLLEPELQAGRLPCLQELASRGRLWLDCVSIFHSITPAATASIVTGRYPAQHGILGMSWWNPDTRDVFYLGADVGTIVKRGVDDFLSRFLLGLNGDRLQAPTLFSLVERQHRTAGCFNHLVFRGDVAHPVETPSVLRLLSALEPGIQVYGPTRLRLGQFVPGTVGSRVLTTLGGTLNRFGLDDEGTERFLHEVSGPDDLPDFSVAYFADYDFAAHERGPTAALTTLRRCDARLSGILEAWGGIGPVLDRVWLILTADHAHSDVRGDDDAGVGLEEVRKRYRCGSPAEGWRPGDELLLCPNMRSLEIYARDPQPRRLDALARATVEDARVDQAIWRDGGDFVVTTADRGTLRFSRAAEEPDAVADQYGGWWHVHGALSAVDGRADERRVSFGRYPNAFERIANGVAHPRAGHLWATARPGYEFRVPGQSVHRKAGSHGTLHELDSLVPLLVAGAGSPPHIPVQPRIVDVAPLAASVLALSLATRVGQSHQPDA